MAKERKPAGYWKNPENIDREFEAVRQRLGRVPKTRELPAGFFYALRGLGKCYNDYLTHRKFKPRAGGNKNPPTAQELDEIFEKRKNELDRAPKFQELPARFQGGLRRGHYSGEIIKYCEYLLSKGITSLRKDTLTPNKIDLTFDEVWQRLGRTPKERELPKGVYAAITRGHYGQDVRTYNQYLLKRGIDANRAMNVWDNKKIDREFDLLMQELGRVPTYKEAQSISYAVSRGRYSGEIVNWVDYLRHRGLLPWQVLFKEKLKDKRFMATKSVMYGNPPLEELLGKNWQAGETEIRDLLVSYAIEEEERPELIDKIRFPSLVLQYLNLPLNMREEVAEFDEKYPEYIGGEGSSNPSFKLSRFNEPARKNLILSRLSNQFLGIFDLFLTGKTEDNLLEYNFTSKMVESAFDKKGRSVIESIYRNFDSGIDGAVLTVAEIRPEILEYWRGR